MYRVIRDTREQAGQGWLFEEGPNCGGTTIQTLKTGDYTIEGFEKALCIERKGTVGEFAQNIVQKRFINELERMRTFAHSFVILEFTLDDLLAFPANSGIPKFLWKKLRISNWFILKKLTEFQLMYPTKFILAGINGREVAASIFKEVSGGSK